MAQHLSPGDEVICRIKDNILVSASSAYDEELSFEIISDDLHGYYLYVPASYNLKETAFITTKVAKALGISKKYVGGQTIYANITFIIKSIIKFDGCICIKCHEYFPQAEPNQPDGSMKCFLCRAYRYR